MMVTATLLEKSIEKANAIFSHSANLSDVRADANIYVDRHEYLTDLLGESGHISFHPLVEKDLTIDFQNALKDDHTKKHDHYYRSYFSTWDDEKKARDEWAMANELFTSVTNDDLLANKVPAKVVRIIESYEVKGYSSPKLSKALVKLFGEDSEVVKWYTNQCPKKLVKGVVEDYKVHLSILPHHIAGMAFYAPYNWGGEKWVTGWNKTSCMDTIRNSEGQGVYQLVPNLLDTTLAVAYLTNADNDDLFNPVYQARLLVRIAKVNDTDFVMLGLRPFYTSNETRNYLVEGLKAEFDNFVHVDDLRKDYEDADKKTFIMDTDFEWGVTVEDGECGHCEGDGYDDDGDMCTSCDGSGRSSDYNEYRPYVDDPDYFSFTDRGVRIKLPIGWLVSKGYMEEPKKEVLPSSLFLAC